MRALLSEVSKYLLYRRKLNGRGFKKNYAYDGFKDDKLIILVELKVKYILYVYKSNDNNEIEL